ncbi:MAG: hypothetical protein ACKOYN_12600 [Planctomycetota bacterium]
MAEVTTKLATMAATMAPNGTAVGAMFADEPAWTDSGRCAGADFDAIGSAAGRSACRLEEDSER